MDIEPGTSSEADKDLAALGDGWAKSLKFIPGFSYKKLEDHLVLEAKKTPDGKPAEALKHKKSGYKLFKAGYPRQIMVKPNVKKGNEAVHFLVRCHVNAEMKKKQYLVYVHLHQHSGDIAYAKCYCPAGAGGCCKHVAATLYQLLDYIELGLSDIPDDKTCTQELQKWHVHAFQTISFKSFGTDVTEPLNFNKTSIPPPPVQCCVPFLVRFDVFWLEQH